MILRINPQLIKIFTMAAWFVSPFIISSLKTKVDVRDVHILLGSSIGNINDFIFFNRTLYNKIFFGHGLISYQIRACVTFAAQCQNIIVS